MRKLTDLGYLAIEKHTILHKKIWPLTIFLGIISWQKIHIDYGTSSYRDIVDIAIS